VAAFASAGVGALIGVVSTSTRMTVLFSQLVFLPSMILGGLMLPFSLLPPALAKVALVLPTTYAMDAFGGLAMGQASGMHPWLSLAILAAGGLMAFGLAVFLFSWDSKNATRRAHPALAALAWTPYLVGLLLSL
jgi:ABC-2 type transport system permease protein